MDPYVLARNLIYRMTSPLCLPYTIFLIVMGTVLYYKVLPIVVRMLACGLAVRVSISIKANFISLSVLSYCSVCVLYILTKSLSANNPGYSIQRRRCPNRYWSQEL